MTMTKMTKMLEISPRGFANEVITCSVCGRNTRQVENTDASLCPECLTLASLDNTINDNGPDTHQGWEDDRDRLLKRAVKRGSDGARIRAHFEYLWPRAE